MGLIIAFLAPEQSSSLGVGIDLPNNDFGQARLEKYELNSSLWGIFYLNNLLMIGLQSPFLWTSPITFAPTAWSTNVELYFYAFISFYAAKSYLNTKIFLIASIVFLAMIGAIITLHELQYFEYFRLSPSMYIRPLSLFYYSFLGWSFFFALGCFIYYLPKRKPPSAVKYGLLAACLITPFYLTKNDPNLFIAMRVFYGVLIAITIMMFSDQCKSGIMRFIGSLSYPLFLIHWPMAGFISWLFGINKNSLEMLCLNLPASLLASLLIVILVERPIEKIRKRFKA